MASVEKHGKKFRGSYRDETGKRRKTPVLPTKRAARQFAEDQEARIRAGLWRDPASGKRTLTDYVEDPHRGWLKLRRGERTTRDAYRSHWNQVKPSLGHYELRRLRSSVIQAWVNDMEVAGVSPSTIKARFTFLQTVLAAKSGVSAIRDGELVSNPCLGVDLPRVAHRGVSIYEPDESDRLLQAMPEWWRPVVLLASETGMRWGELMGLSVGDFDDDFKALVVRKTVVETRKEHTGNGTPFMWKNHPKSHSPRRIALTTPAREAMLDLVRQRELGVDDRMFSMPTRLPRERRRRVDLTPDIVSGLGVLEFNGREYRHGTVNCYQVAGCRCDFCRQASADYRYARLSDVESSAVWTPRRTDAWPEGLPIGKSFWRTTVWLPANRVAGLEPRRFHDLRASHISWLLAMGLDLPTVMARAGHKGFETTQRYTKALNDSDERVLRAMDALRRRHPTDAGDAVD